VGLAGGQGTVLALARLSHNAQTHPTISDMGSLGAVLRIGKNLPRRAARFGRCNLFGLVSSRLVITKRSRANQGEYDDVW
jgi:hypothetical protein